MINTCSSRTAKIYRSYTFWNAIGSTKCIHCSQGALWVKPNIHHRIPNWEETVTPTYHLANNIPRTTAPSLTLQSWHCKTEDRPENQNVQLYQIPDFISDEFDKDFWVSLFLKSCWSSITICSDHSASVTTYALIWVMITLCSQNRRHFSLKCPTD